jgi:hypothetical protein
LYHCRNSGKNAGAIQIQIYVETTKYIQKRYLLKIMPELRATPELRAITTPELWAMTSAGKMDNYFTKPCKPELPARV